MSPDTRRIGWVFETALVLFALAIGSVVVGPALSLGTSADPVSEGRSAVATTIPLPPQPPGDPGTPQLIRIPAIGVEADVIELGLNPDRSLEVPGDFEETGWYTGRSVPGEPGPAIIAGHVDSYTGPAVFNRLQKLDDGDLVLIDRSDGMTVRYIVTSNGEVAKSNFPTDLVYGTTPEPTLRLVTCGGAFDRDERSYTGNRIVFAEHLDTVVTADI